MTGRQVGHQPFAFDAEDSRFHFDADWCVKFLAIVVSPRYFPTQVSVVRGTVDDGIGESINSQNISLRRQPSRKLQEKDYSAPGRGGVITRVRKLLVY